MKKLPILLMLIIFSTSVFAYVKPDYYNGLQMKFYDEKIDKQVVFDIFSNIDRQHYESVSSIAFFEDTRYCQNNCGIYYFYSRRINVCCINEGVIAHELTHNVQEDHKESASEMMQHTGNFCSHMKEIGKNLDINNSYAYKGYC